MSFPVDEHGSMGALILGGASKARDELAAILGRLEGDVRVVDQIRDADRVIEDKMPSLLVLTEATSPFLTFCRRMRSGASGDMTTVLVAVHADDQDVLPAVLDAGADDYIILPLHPKRLNARMALSLRKAEEKVQRKEVEVQLARRVKQQSLVAELGHKALSGAGVAELSDLAVNIVADALEVEFARVLKHVPEEALLRMSAGVGWEEGSVGRFTLPADERWQAGYTLLSSEPVITNDVSEEGRFGLVPFMIEHGVTSSISVTVPGRQAPYGVLSAHSRRHRTFSQDDIHFVQSVANVLAAAVERGDEKEILERSEARAQRLAAVASRTINGVIITDPERRIEWVNEGFERITGYALEEVHGKVPGRILQGEETSPETIAYIRRQLSRNEGFTTEIVNYRKSGEKYWVRIEVQPLLNESGQLTGYMAIETDVTKQRLAERALRESEARARAILETTVDGVVTIDVHGTIESFNSAAESIFQYRSEEVLGHNVKVLMPSPYVEEHDSYLTAYLETGRRKIIGIGREVVGRRKDGSTFPMELSVSEVPLGERIIFTGIIRDITERRRLEQEILEISEQERRRIGQDLHDGLGQTLTGIGLISKNLERRLRAAGFPEAEQAAEVAELIKEADQQARGLARGLVPVELDASGLATALQRLAANAERFFSVKCTFEQIGRRQLHDATAATHLYRIAQEAVSNAIKHGRATKVAMTLATGDDRVRLRIQDNGTGFPDVIPDTQGMGVRIMRYRARMIGGTLDIRDNPDRGALVTCTLNRAPGIARADRHSPKQEAVPS